GCTVTDDGGPVNAEQRRAAHLGVVDAAPETLEGRHRQLRPDLRAGVPHELFLDHGADHLGQTLGDLQGDVPGEAVGDHDVTPAVVDVAAFHVAHEVQRRLAQMLVRLLRQLD